MSAHAATDWATRTAVSAAREYSRADGLVSAPTAMGGGGGGAAVRARVPKCAVLDPIGSSTWESEGDAHFFYRFIVNPWRPFQLIQLDFHKPGPQFAIEHLNFVRVTGANVYDKTPFSLTVELGATPSDPQRGEGPFHH